MTGLPDSWRRELAILQGQLDAFDANIAAARKDAVRGREGGLSFAHEASAPHAVRGEPLKLRDGSRVVIRPIEPGDAVELRRGLLHLSELSAYRRFRAHVTEVSEEELEYLTRIDHVRHEAIAALDPRTGAVLGVVRYVCDPAEPEQAEITYVVADDWQDRGVGSALIDRLAARARAAGVQRFIATTLAVDARARRLLTRVADPVSEQDRDGICETVARLRQ